MKLTCVLKIVYVFCFCFFGAITCNLTSNIANRCVSCTSFKKKYQPVSQQVSAIIRNAKSPVLFLAVRFTLQLDIVHCSKQQ